MTISYGSICSGIDAPTVAWKPLGWKAAFYSEIEAFPRAVLTHHYGDTQLHGDFTTIEQGQYPDIDVLVGGTPCQEYCIAGPRGGLDSERGSLVIKHFELAKRLRSRWLVWENVTGVLSSNGGRDFGSIVGHLGKLGYGYAYRTLDAKNFGSAAPRERIFLVGYAGDWRPAAAVLFERESFARDSKARRNPFRPLHPCLTAKGARAFDDRTGYVLEDSGVRITTPEEHERILGFPAGYTRVPFRGSHAKDGPRFKALGNSMDVRCMRWLGERIGQVEALINQREAVA